MSTRYGKVDNDEYEDGQANRHHKALKDLSAPVRVSAGPIPNIAKDPFRLEWNVNYARAARVLQDKFRHSKSLKEFIAFVDAVEKLA